MKKIYIGGFIVLVLLVVLYVVLPGGDYYEYEANSATACLPGEEYDSEYKVCYFDFYCETDAECNVVDEKYGQVLDALATEYEASDRDHHETNKVSDTEKSSLDLSGTQTQKVTQIMQAIVPKERLVRIKEIIAESDGPDGTLAYVEPVTDDGSQWKMAYDPVDSFNTDGSLKNKKELLTTLIHEYAHVLALNNSQVKFIGPEVQTISCREGESILDEGCGNSEAYLTKFIDAYWTEAEREETRNAAQVGNSEDYAFDLYNNRPDDFVTEYAATNETEDFAESFALFVMQSERSESRTIKNQKIASFYEYDELVSLRKHMRGGLLKILEK